MFGINELLGLSGGPAVLAAQPLCAQCSGSEQGSPPRAGQDCATSMYTGNCEMILPVRDYDLAATLTSGQSFRWRLAQDEWEGVIGLRWVRLKATDKGILARTAAPVADWSWLTHYLQTDIELEPVLLSFPDDEPMRAAVVACRGLRLLRQEPWECLASFILSSTKQIVQIQQIVAVLCERFGSPLLVPAGRQPVCAFPPADRLAAASESELR